MRCVVTGGLGFIGSHLVDKLIKDRNEVHVIDNLSTGSLNHKNNDAHYLLAPVESSNSIDYILKIRPDWLFHLAALPRIQPSYEEPILHDDANVRACIKLYDVAKSLNLDAFIFASSSAVYGNPIEVPTSETANINPLSPYALQKYAGERYLHILAERSGTNVCSLRFFNPYGPRSFNPNNPYNAYSSVVGIFQHQSQHAENLTVTGDGSQRRDFIHISDVIAAIILCAQKISVTKGQVYNVGTGKTLSILDLAKMFKRPICHIDARPGEAQVTCADIKKLNALGWYPKIEISRALSEGIL